MTLEETHVNRSFMIMGRFGPQNSASLSSYGFNLALIN